MNKEYLKRMFQIAKDNEIGICIELEMPNQEKHEYIINDYDSLDVKLEYYLNTYNDLLIHKNNDQIIIADIFPTIVNFNDHILAERYYVKYEND